jgi:hypothetical protein
VKMKTIQLTCWVCGQDFDREEPLSSAVLGRGSDLCPKPFGGNFLAQLVHSCPGCGFTGDARAFHPSHEDEQVQHWMLAGGLAGVADQLPDSGYGSYELAAVCHARRRAVSALQLAEFYVAASWSAQLEEALDVVPRYQAEAVRHLEQALMSGQVVDEELAVMTYLAGELRRRLGEFEAALQLFDESAIHFTQHGGPRWLMRALGQQAGLAKEGSSADASLAQ